MQTYLKNCMICDGSGDKAYQSGILIEGKLIKVITEKISEGFAGEIIDCGNKLVTPGFIDCHSHNDWFALANDRDAYFKTFIAQGITTFVTGNCGFSAAGYNPSSKYINEIGGGLFYLDEPTGKAACFNDWFSELDRGSIANIASLAGHGTARISVNGKKDESLSQEQEDDMLALLESALREGACGISLGLMYEPGIYSSTGELAKVAELCAKYDRILTVHPRAESAISLSYRKINRSHLLLALDELDDIVRKTGVRLQYSHLIFVGRRTWRDVSEAEEILKKMKEDGYDTGFDMYPFDYGASIITVVLPDWYQAMELKKRKNLLVQMKLAFMVKATTLLLGFDFSDITIAYAGEDQMGVIGKTVEEIARERKKGRLDTYLDICEKSNFNAKVLMGGYQNQGIVLHLMENEQSLYMTDAWVEKRGKQNGGVYGAFPRFMELALHSGYPIEKAISKMTGKTASRYHLNKHGYIREGHFANINVIDPISLKSRADECLPPLGMEYVFMNGVPVMKEGKLADPLPKAGMAVKVI